MSIGESFHGLDVDCFFPGETGGIGRDWAGLKSPLGLIERVDLAGRESIPGGPIHGSRRGLGFDPGRGGLNRTWPEDSYTFWNHVNRTSSLEVLRGHNLLWHRQNSPFAMYDRWPLLVISCKNSTRLGSGTTVQNNPSLSGPRILTLNPDVDASTRHGPQGYNRQFRAATADEPAAVISVTHRILYGHGVCQRTRAE
jgi:hypothetical protein